MPRIRATEVDAYIFIKADLKRLGWNPKNPTRVSSGEVFTQGECLSEPRIQEQLGQTKPENIVKISETEYYVIEAKANKRQIEQALREAEVDYADKINQSRHIKARIISGIAGNEVDDYLVKSKFLVNGRFEPIISNGKELTSLVPPTIARFLIENNTNVIEDLPIDEKLFLETAKEINVILHNGAIPATERGKVISALLLSLVGETEPNVDSTPMVLINDINTRVNAKLQSEGRPEFYDYIRITPPTTKANHKKFKKALVRTIQELRNLNIRSAMNSGTDVLGSFYEVFLQYGNWAKEIGIVLTPRDITRYAAEILDVNQKDLIYDPTCGTGGFLVAAFDRAKRNSNEEEIAAFKENNIFGVDQEASVVSLAIVNMIFRGDGKTNIKEANCMSEWLNLKRKGRFNTAEYVENDYSERIPPITKVLMNPPFALKEADDQEHKFVNQALSQMQDRGLLLAILPYSELIKDGVVLQWRREELLAKNSLLAVISLTEDLFYPVASKHTCAIIVRKGIPHNYDTDVLWVKITDDGYVKRKKKRIKSGVRENDITRSEPLIVDFLHNNIPLSTSVPRFIKALPIRDRHADLELVPEVNLDNYDYDLATIKNQMQTRLRGILSYAIQNGYFPFDVFKLDTRARALAPIDIQWQNSTVTALFEVVNGLFVSDLELKEEKANGYLPIFRPTQSIHNLVAGWIDKDNVAGSDIHKAGSIMVSTDGQGSHSYSYITPIDSIPNSNVAVLNPREPMPFSFQLFITAAITNERWRFSYGRKPKGNRLKNLIIKVPINADGDVNVHAFENLVKEFPEYPLVEKYLRFLRNN